jgi:hypothetical protein
MEKKNAPEEKQRDIQSILACFSQIGKLFNSATGLKRGHAVA